MRSAVIVVTISILLLAVIITAQPQMSQQSALSARSVTAAATPLSTGGTAVGAIDPDYESRFEHFIADSFHSQHPNVQIDFRETALSPIIAATSADVPAYQPADVDMSKLGLDPTMLNANADEADMRAAMDENAV